MKSMEKLIKEILYEWVDDYSVDANINIEWLAKHIVDELNEKGDMYKKLKTEHTNNKYSENTE